MPALATANNKPNHLMIVNTSCIIKSNTKFAESQFLKREDTKQTRPFGAADQKIRNDYEDAHLYVNELMKAFENDHQEDKLWFPTLENTRNEKQHTSIQRCIGKEIRKLINKKSFQKRAKIRQNSRIVFFA